MSTRGAQSPQSESSPAGRELDGSAEFDSPAAWRRLAISVLLSTVGGVGMWSAPVALSAVQADFGITRGEASLPYTVAMMGFALGGVLMGRLSDRRGIVTPLACGAAALSVGNIAAALAANSTLFILAYGLLIGVGASASFGPLVADASQWFMRRRGIAVAIATCGNYLAGTVWPPLLQYFISTDGWRATHIGIGIFCALAMPPLIWALRRPPPKLGSVAAATVPRTTIGLGLSPNTLQVALCLAGLSCCVAMAMPQVHIVAYCGDLGYGVARGAEMLSLMLGLGMVSRVGSGFVADRIGGVMTLLLGSALQGVALFLYLLFDGLVSLYVVSGLFGLFQGGIVAMYAIIVRECFAPREAGTRIGLVLMATVVGMALGGWMSGVIFDLTGSYRVAFANGLLWNLLNMAIALWLLIRPRGRLAPA